jgi:hypothetical protein
MLCYVFLLLCMFCSRYSVLLFCSVYCLCVNVYRTTATEVNPIAINKYIIYHIKKQLSKTFHFLLHIPSVQFPNLRIFLIM